MESNASVEIAALKNEIESLKERVEILERQTADSVMMALTQTAGLQALVDVLYSRVTTDADEFLQEYDRQFKASRAAMINDFANVVGSMT